MIDPTPNSWQERLDRLAGPPPAPEIPWLFVVSADNLPDIAALANHEPHDVRLRALRADRARSVDGLFAEWALALRYPEYAGATWGAFAECLADAVWEPRPTGMDRVEYAATPLAVVASRGPELLADAPSELGTFIDVVSSTLAEPPAAEPLPTSTLHLLLHAEPDECDPLRERLRAAYQAT